MPKPIYPRDRFDDVPAAAQRVGAHRADNPRRRGGPVIIWAAAAAIVVIVGVIVGTLALTGRLGTPQAVPTTVAPTVTPMINTSYDVLILDATGASGQTTKAKDAVARAGWDADAITPGQAGSTYPTTTVYYASAADAAAAAGLAKVVGARAVVLSDRYQSTTDTAGIQLTVVLGADRVSSPSPSS